MHCVLFNSDFEWYDFIGWPRHVETWKHICILNSNFYQSYRLFCRSVCSTVAVMFHLCLQPLEDVLQLLHVNPQSELYRKLVSWRISYFFAVGIVNVNVLWAQPLSLVMLHGSSNCKHCALPLLIAGVNPWDCMAIHWLLLGLNRCQVMLILRLSDNAMFIRLYFVYTFILCILELEPCVTCFH